MVNYIERVLTTNCFPNLFEVSENTLYRPMFTNSEIELIVKVRASYATFNGDAIRLDSFKNGKCVLSKVGFYDFISSNLLVSIGSQGMTTSDKLINELVTDPALSKVNECKKLLLNRIKAKGKLKSVNDVLAINELSNIIAVSVYLEDECGNVLFVERSKNVIVSAKMLSVACSGSMTTEDLSSSNPFLACAFRELKEELNIEADLKFQQLIISLEKYQPVVLVKGIVKGNFTNYKKDIMKAKDFNVENTHVYSVPKKLVKSMLNTYKFTDAAGYQLTLNSKSGLFDFLKANDKVDVRKYSL